MIIDGHTLASAIDDGTWKAFIEDEPMRSSAFNIGPNSINLTLGSRLLRQQQGGVVDPVDEPDSLTWQTINPNALGKFLLLPGEFCLGYVRERFETHEPLWITHQVTDDRLVDEQATKTYFVQMFDGRSTVARLGIAVHVTAGFGDYGFASNFTMEMYNFSRRAMLLTPGMQIAQLHFQAVTPNVLKVPYAGVYLGKNGGPHPPVLGRKRFFKE